MTSPAAAAAPCTCPRCGTAFHCGAGDVLGCACARLELPAQLLQALGRRYQGCLCLPCLHTLAQDAGAQERAGAAPDAADAPDADAPDAAAAPATSSAASA